MNRRPSGGACLGVALVAWSCGCAHGTASGVAPPPTDTLMEMPAAVRSEGVDAAGLTHLLRGQYYLALGLPAAAVPHLRLALIYARGSGYLHMKLAEAWAAVGEIPLAQKAVDAGLAAAPHDPWLNLDAGLLARDDGDFVHAAEHLRTALRGADSLAATDSLARELRGLALPALVDVLAWQPAHRAEGLALADAALAHDATDPLAAQHLAGVLEDHGVLEASAAAYAKASALRPSDEIATLGQARVLSLLGRDAAAADALIGLFAFYPDALPIYVEIIQHLRRAGSPLADTYRGEALRLSEHEPEARLRVALGDLSSGAVDAGAALLTSLLERHPDLPQARLHLLDLAARRADPQACLALARTGLPPLAQARATALCQASGGHLDATLEVLLGAVPHLQGKSGVDLLNDYVRELATLRDDALALRRFDEALGRFGNVIRSEEALAARASLLTGLGRNDAALAVLDELASSSPEDMNLQLRRAELLLQLGRSDAGLAVFRQAAREQPSDPLRLNALGYTLVELDRELDAAEVYLRRAHRLSAEDSFVVDSLGWLAFKRGDLDLARRLLERAHLASPDDAEIGRHLAQVLSRQGQKDAARRLLDTLLRLRPTASQRRQLESDRAALGAGA